jgi:hypothetical protein
MDGTMLDGARLTVRGVVYCQLWPGFWEDQTAEEFRQPNGGAAEP